jgi:hypothetical protein
MKRIILAASLGLGILSFTMAGATSHAVVPMSQELKYDTVPHDTTSPLPKPDTARIR